VTTRRVRCALRALPALSLSACLASGLVTALAGCATAPSAPAAWQGRLALQVAARGTAPARSLTAAFELQGDESRGSLDIGSPWGTTAARARWSDGRYLLDDGQQTRQFGQFEDLAEQALGQRLPLAALFHWLRGKPWPGASHALLDAGAGPGFSQLGWQVETAALAEGLLTLTRTDPPATVLRLRLDSAPRPP
jgi:outer membrane lipoprotein LolB